MRGFSGLGRTAAALTVLAGIVASGATARAGGGYPDGGDGYDRFIYEARFTVDRPEAATGLEQVIDYVNQGDPEAKPAAVEQVYVRLPRGSRIDPTVPARCEASDPALMLGGGSACPPESRVGDGELEADTGAPGEAGSFPRSAELAVGFFNGTEDLIFVGESTNTLVPVRVVAHFAVGKRSFTSTVPPLPGLPPPDPYIAIDRAASSLDRVSAPDGATGYITTPARCRKGQRWRFLARLTYRDGVEQEQQATMRCRAGKKRR